MNLLRGNSPKNSLYPWWHCQIAPDLQKPTLGIGLFTFGSLFLFLLPCFLFANFMNRSEARHILSIGTTVQGTVNRISHEDYKPGYRGTARSETNYVGFDYPDASGKQVSGGTVTWVSERDIAGLGVGSRVTLVRTPYDVYLKAPVERRVYWNLFDAMAVATGLVGIGLTVTGSRLTKGMKGWKW